MINIRNLRVAKNQNFAKEKIDFNCIRQYVLEVLAFPHRTLYFANIWLYGL